ncbi:inovirus Gp2 family protein [Methanocella paludicola]|nr:inovirus Gp2 family protein [Methanocella paludicola]
MTLTERSTAKNKDKIMKHYRRLMDNLKKEYPGLKAFWVKEFTKRGVRHLHVALNMYIPQARIKKLWTRATDGESYIVHIEDTCEVRNAAGYMMKYMTKQLEGGDNFKTHERRYGFNGEKRPKPPEWEGKAEGEIEVEIDPHFNPQLKILVQLLQYEPNRIWPLLH